MATHRYAPVSATFHFRVKIRPELIKQKDSDKPVTLTFGHFNLNISNMW